ncbi:MAG TPA: saccharopine dehydrogenase NADP-binding domain-containing protein, partial [Anaerolineae bacterium]
MPSDFLVYGSTGFVGDAVTRLSLQQGLKPIIAGRNAAKVQAQAAELGLEFRAIGLDDSGAIDAVLKQVRVVLHCAGPYLHTYKPIADACLRTGTHYLDLTGEMLV